MGLRYGAMLPALDLHHVPAAARIVFSSWILEFRQADRGSIRGANDQTYESRARNLIKNRNLRTGLNDMAITTSRSQPSRRAKRSHSWAYFFVVLPPVILLMPPVLFSLAPPLRELPKRLRVMPPQPELEFHLGKSLRSTFPPPSSENPVYTLSLRKPDHYIGIMGTGGQI
jgi:hypothetical protein